MNKETREKITEFKKREAGLLLSILENPSQDAVFKLYLSKLRKERANWLGEIGGKTQDLPAETMMKLDELVARAAESISLAALRHFQLEAYINDAHKNGSNYGRCYEMMIENYGQLEALSEMAAEGHIRALERFNNKINGRSFLSVLLCKFKKAKSQEAESSKADDAKQK